MAKLFDPAAITTWLAALGAVVLVFWCIIRKVLSLPIFPSLTKVQGVGILRLIINWAFVIVIMIAFFAFIIRLCGVFVELLKIARKEPPIVINGRVIDDEEEGPIEGAIVEIEGAKIEERRTDSLGRFELIIEEQPEAGTITVQIEAQGYKNYRQGIKAVSRELEIRLSRIRPEDKIIRFEFNQPEPTKKVRDDATLVTEEKRPSIEISIDTDGISMDDAQFMIGNVDVTKKCNIEGNVITYTPSDDDDFDYRLYFVTVMSSAMNTRLEKKGRRPISISYSPFNESLLEAIRLNDQRWNLGLDKKRLIANLSSRNKGFISAALKQDLNFFRNYTIVGEFIFKEAGNPQGFDMTVGNIYSYIIGDGDKSVFTIKKESIKEKQVRCLNSGIELRTNKSYFFRVRKREITSSISKLDLYVSGEHVASLIDDSVPKKGCFNIFVKAWHTKMELLWLLAYEPYTARGDVVKEAIPLLIDDLSSEVVGRRKSAIELLEKFTGKTNSYDDRSKRDMREKGIIRWEVWWEGIKDGEKWNSWWNKNKARFQN